MSIQVEQAALFADVVRNRHSVRKYDANWTISKEEMTELLQEATLAPSGGNLQPWRFLVIDDAELKQKLLPIAYNQEQIVQASAVVAVLGDLQAIDKAEQIYSAAVEAGYVSEQAKGQMLQSLRGFYSPSERVKSAALIDGGLVSMQFMLSAKSRGYDTVPMTGFDEQQLRSAFRISDRYSLVMLIAVGKAAQEAHKTVRLPVEEVAFWNAFPEEA